MAIIIPAKLLSALTCLENDGTLVLGYEGSEPHYMEIGGQLNAPAALPLRKLRIAKCSVREWTGSSNRAGRFGVNCVLFLPRIEPRFLFCRPLSLLAIHTTLSPPLHFTLCSSKRERH
jgi:hypothetical protein